MNKNGLVLPASADARDVARILRQLALARFGGPCSRGSMCLAVRPIDRAILLVKSSYRRTWGLPGGFLEPNEDPLVGGERELFEETRASLYEPRMVVQWKRKHHIDHLIAGVVTNTPYPASWEISQVRWLAFDDATPTNRDLHGITQTMLRAIPGGLPHYVNAMLARYQATDSPIP